MKVTFGFSVCEPTLAIPIEYINGRVQLIAYHQGFLFFCFLVYYFLQKVVVCEHQFINAYLLITKNSSIIPDKNTQFKYYYDYYSRKGLQFYEHNNYMTFQVCSIYAHKIYTQKNTEAIFISLKLHFVKVLSFIEEIVHQC